MFDYGFVLAMIGLHMAMNETREFTKSTTAIKSLPDELIHFTGKVFEAAYQFQSIRCGDLTLNEAAEVFNKLQSVRRSVGNLEKTVNRILDKSL